MKSSTQFNDTSFLTVRKDNYVYDSKLKFIFFSEKSFPRDKSAKIVVLLISAEKISSTFNRKLFLIIGMNRREDETSH